VGRSAAIGLPQSPTDELQRRLGVTLHERSVGKVLARLGYRKLSVRPRNPQADEEVEETVKKASTVTAQIPTAPRVSSSSHIVPPLLVGQYSPSVRALGPVCLLYPPR
jgi:Winged helix-turn helix